MSPHVTVDLHRVADTTIEGSARHHRVAIDRPEAKGGRDRGPMGGELLLLGLGGCFLSNLIAAAKAREVTAEDLAVSVTATLADAPPRFTTVTSTSPPAAASPSSPTPESRSTPAARATG